MLRQILDFFASLLIHDYRDICCVEMWTSLRHFDFEKGINVFKDKDPKDIL